MRYSLALILVAVFFFNQSIAGNIQKTDSLPNQVVTSKKGYTLTFIVQADVFSPEVQKKMIKAFFKVYPKQVKKYNPDSPREVTFIVDSSYKGVAATFRDAVRFNPDWFAKNPEDIDVVTHEAMHVVQAYRFRRAPSWITEGIADYVRYEFGVNNKKANWTLPDYNPRQSYEDSYRITARFLVWITKHFDSDFVVKLDKQLRSGTYEGDIWKEETGFSLDELWKQYAASPELKLKYK